MTGTGDRWLSRDELRRRLIRAGQSVAVEGPPLGGGVRVEMTPERIVTVALYRDYTLKPAFRERYFVTYVDEDDQPTLGMTPRFAWPDAFAEIIGDENRSDGGFLDGPFRWLVARLAASPRVLVWPASRDDPSGGFLGGREEVGEVPMTRLAAWLRRDPAVPPGVGAICLDLSHAEDCRVLWEIAERVEADCEDFFVGDPECAEVCKLHHHDKVMISIVDPERRNRLVEELAGCSEDLARCDGYDDPSDDEAEDDELAS